MKIGLIGLSEDYDRNKGLGIQKYMYEIYSLMHNYSKELELEKTGYKNTLPLVGAAPSFFLGNLFYNFTKYQIIHNMDQKPFLPLRRGNALLLTTIHDFQPLLSPEYNDSSFKELIWQTLIDNGTRMALNSDHLIVRSTLTYADAIRLGYKKKKITLINAGIAPQYSTMIKKQIRKSFVVGYLGAFRKRKNVIFAISAIKQLKQKDVFFNVWGKPRYLFKELCKQASTNKQIRFMGFAPENQTIRIYDSFDVFVYPSLYEGFGLPIIEAQARGLPVIIYKFGKIPLEVKKYCFEATDEHHMAQIIQELKENGYNEKLKKKSMAYARNFTWEKEAHETFNLYKKLLDTF